MKHHSLSRLAPTASVALFVLSVLVSLVGGGCGAPLLVATFTSRIVQLETCRTVGDGTEGCVGSEQIAERRLDLVEAEPGLFWLYGLPRDGVADRAILGSRDNAGGFLFVDEREQQNSATGCVLTTRVTVSLAVEDGRADDVGVNACVSLVGRSVDIVSASAACDDNVPPQQVVQTIRRRFEALGPDTTCTP
jgi:hypothetical protein